MCLRVAVQTTLRTFHKLIGSWRQDPCFLFDRGLVVNPGAILITAIVALTGPLLEGLPLAVRLALTTALAVPLMTWVVMPRVTRLLRGWLYPEQADERRFP